jgi:predicted adenylyl cyclase CyaB
MIEVEKKFQPSSELTRLLESAQFVKEKEFTDIYYDLPDFSYFKKGIRLRKRDDQYELKIEKEKMNDYLSGAREEITDNNEILEKIAPNEKNLEDFVKSNLEILCSITTNRKVYKLGEFTIDLDTTNYGYEMCEIELQVENESQVPDAEQKIIFLAENAGLKVQKQVGKIAECLRVNRPEVYNELYIKNKLV